MADNEIIGRTSCPVCGCAGQDVKINKNNKLYMFCDNGCAVKWNSAQSRKYLPQLRSGVAVTTETGSIIKSTIKKEFIENETRKMNLKIAPAEMMPEAVEVMPEDGQTENLPEPQLDAMTEESAAVGLPDFSRR